MNMLRFKAANVWRESLKNTKILQDCLCKAILDPVAVWLDSSHLRNWIPLKVQLRPG